MIYKTPILETERLILKKGMFEDYVKVYEYDFTYLRNIDGEFEYVKTNPNDLIGFDTYALETDNVLDFIAYLKDNLVPIANIVLDRYDADMKSLEISVNLHPKYWRKGYMTEAILKIMDYVYNNFDIENIVYGYACDNYKSKGLSDKIGFEFYFENTVHYKRIDKDIKEIKTIMSKDKFNELYKKKAK